MARLFRWFALVALLMVCASASHALIPAPTEYSFPSLPAFVQQYGWSSSKPPACDNLVLYYKNSNATATSGTVENNGVSCYVRNVQGAPIYEANFGSRPASCPANSTAVTDGCECASGYQENASRTACELPGAGLDQFCQDHAAAKNTFKMAGTVAASAGLPSSSCYVPYPPFEGADLGKGCSASIGNKVGVVQGDGTLDWSGSGSFDGTTCSAAPGEPTPPSKDDPCPGGFEGTVNGVTKCVPAEPDKGIEGVKDTSSTGADGTRQDVKETTKCEGTKCTTTTTTTTTTASGSVSTSTTSSTTSMADKCKADPTNPICSKTQGGLGAGVSQGTCQENSSAEGCGGEGAGIGDLYTKKEKTVQQVLNKAREDLSGSPLGTSVGGFFNVSAGGSCPTVSGNIPLLNATFTFDAFCTPLAAQMFAVLRGVLLMLAAWMAFRVAIDH